MGVTRWLFVFCVLCSSVGSCSTVRLRAKTSRGAGCEPLSSRPPASNTQDQGGVWGGELFTILRAVPGAVRQWFLSCDPPLALKQMDSAAPSPAAIAAWFALLLRRLPIPAPAAFGPLRRFASSALERALFSPTSSSRESN